MDYASKMTNNKLAISGTVNKITLDAENAYQLILLSTITGTHFLMTPATSDIDAAVTDFLLPANEVVTINVGRGLNRLTSITEGATGSLYIGALTP